MIRMGVRLTIIAGPYQGLVGCLIDRRDDGLLTVTFPTGTETMHGASVSRGVFDHRWVLLTKE
jgi:hypothetical protein